MKLEVSEVRPHRTGTPYISSIEVGDHFVMASGGTGNRLVLATTDGKTFHRRAAPRANGLRGARIIDGAMWLTGEYGTLAVSKDRAESWQARECKTQECVWDVIRDNKGVMWIAGSGAFIGRSTDGKKWTKVKHALKPRDDRADPRIELVGAGVFFTLFGVYWNGKQFVKPKGVRGQLCSLALSPQGTVVVVGDKGVAFRSIDGGVSFKAVELGSDVDFDDVAYVAGGFVAAGDKGTLRRSLDDGVTWKPLASKTKHHLWSIGSWGSGAFVGGDGGLILRLDSERDTYWQGARDDFGMVIDATGFTPPSAPAPEVLAARYDKLLAEARAAHDALAKPPARASEDAALEAEIVARPDDADAYLVLADVLQSRGDPRGELIVAQHRGDQTAKDVLKRDKQRLLGKLASLTDVVKLEWRWGFARKARVANTFERSPDHEGKKPEVDIAEVLGILLDEPTGRFLRELTIGVVTFEDNSYAGITAALAARALPTLRKLVLGYFDSEETELNWSSIGKVAPLSAATPNLEELVLRSGTMQLGTLVLPRLASFEFAGGGLDKASLNALLDSHLPSLETLVLELGSERWGGSVTLKGVLPLLSSERFPRLRRLGLCNSELTDKLCPHLPGSPLVAQLRELDLSDGVMSDTGARILAAHAVAFKHLDTLDVSNNFITPTIAKQLRKAIPCVELGEQRDDDGDPDARYIAGGE